MAATTFTGSSVWSVSPTENDLAGAEGTGAGRVIQEKKIGPSLRGSGSTAGATGYVLSGFTLPASGSRTSISVAAGEACINGYFIKGTTGLTISANASTTAYVYLQLVLSSSLVSSVAIRTEYVETTKPANAILLGVLTTDASNVTARVDARPQRKMVYGQVDSTGAVLDYGTGDWTATKTATGAYTITFYPAFLRKPCVFATNHSTSTGMTAAASPGSTSVMTVETYNTSGGLADADFSFMAVL